MKDERITHVAIKWNDGGNTVKMASPARHHNIFWSFDNNNPQPTGDCIQGFWTNADRFVDRREAARIAVASGQRLRVTSHDDILFSEDIW